MIPLSKLKDATHSRFFHVFSIVFRFIYRLSIIGKSSQKAEAPSPAYGGAPSIIVATLHRLRYEQIIILLLTISTLIYLLALSASLVGGITAI